MTRVCIVGNSHVAALRNGSARIAAQFPDIEATFFGVPGRWLRSVKLVRGQNGTPGSLAPADPEHSAFFRKMSGGQDRINVADYDCFILVGLELSIFRWLSFYYQMRHEPFSFEVGHLKSLMQTLLRIVVDASLRAPLAVPFSKDCKRWVRHPSACVRSQCLSALSSMNKNRGRFCFSMRMSTLWKARFAKTYCAAFLRLRVCSGNRT